jgi:hypothetical protein
MRFSRNEQIEVPKVSISKSIKVPYVSELLDITNSECHPHKHMHENLYCVENTKFITHFYSKNNLILHKRNKRTSFFEFVTDFIEGSYKFLEFKNIQGRIVDGGKLVFRTTKGDWVLIAQTVELQDSKRYIVVYNISQNKNLLLVSKENEIYSRFLPVISNNIIPIMQFRRDGVFIYLIDLSNETVHFSKWDLDDMKQLMLEILRICEEHDSIISKVSEDKIDYIHDIMLWRIYGYPTRTTSDERAFYISAIKILIDDIQIIGENYDYALSRFGISLELVGNTMSIYWYHHPFYEEDGLLYIMKKGVICKYPKSEDDMVFYIRENRRRLVESHNELMRININLNTKSEGIYLVKEIYRDDFHYITQDHNGIKTVTCGEPQDFYLDYDRVAVYRYKKYIFMIKYQPDIDLVFLEVIDIHRNFLVGFSVDSEMHSIVQHRILYHFHPLDDINKVLFLHVQFDFMIILDLIEMERVLNELYNQRNNLECKEHLNKEAKCLIMVFRFGDLITRAIYDYNPDAGLIYDINVISSCLDKQNNRLYLLAKYMQNSHKVTGLFVWNVSNRDVRFSVARYNIESDTSAVLKVMNRVRGHYNKHLGISDKIDLHGIDLHKQEYRFRKLVGMDVLFDTYNRFADIRNNRISLPILGIGIEKAGLRVDNLRDFLFLSYGAFGIRNEDDWETEIDFSSCFILLKLSLVAQIPNFEL